MSNTTQQDWPRTFELGGVTVTLYKRVTGSGNTGYMLAYREHGKRVFKSFSDETKAIDAANDKLRLLSTVSAKAACLTPDELTDAAIALEVCKANNMTLTVATAKLMEHAAMVGGLANVTAACQQFALQNGKVTGRLIEDAVKQFLTHKGVPETLKRGDKISRHGRDLKLRLGKFSAAFVNTKTDAVNTMMIQAWLDGLKDNEGNRLSPQSCKNYRTVLFGFFEYCARYKLVHENPVKDTEEIKVKGGKTEIFSPDEMRRMLVASSPSFTPFLALCGFAGLRTAEFLRLEWKDINREEKFIEITADKAKTASRRTVPISDNLLAWLAPYAEKTGRVWAQSEGFLHVQARAIAKKADVKWRDNALRHSAASYWLAGCNDAGRVAGYLGNSPAVVHRHYKQLVTPSAALAWFDIRPEKQLPAPK